MTEWLEWTTATPTYCHACGSRIALPGTFLVVQGYSYHEHCKRPYLGPQPVTVDADGECENKENVK